MSFNNKSILITGGTGSFGQSFAKYILENYKPKKLIIFSRNEYNQHKLKNDFLSELGIFFASFSQSFTLSIILSYFLLISSSFLSIINSPSIIRY